jgi:antirestriction protein
MELYVFYKDEQSFEVDLEWVTPDEEEIREACMDEWEERTEDPKPSEEDWFENVRYGSDHDVLKQFIEDGKIADFSELEEWVTSDTLTEGAKEAWLRNIGTGGSISEAEESYVGRFDSPRDFARWYVDVLIDLDGVSDLITSNIDWDGVATDLMIDGFWEVNDHYFRNS